MTIFRRVLRGVLRRMKVGPVSAAREEVVRDAVFRFGACVVVHVTGGLCNQLMCYAAARRIANLKNECPILVVTDGFYSSDHTVWALDRYPIRAALMTDSRSLLDKARYSVGGQQNLQYSDLFDSLGRCIEDTVFEEMENQIVNRVVSFCDFNLALYYFRSDLSKYRPDTKLRSEMTLPESSLSKFGREMLGRISDCESVAVHIRRGDFTGPQNDLAVRPAYYVKACDELRSRLNRPRFFVFSDEPEWCRDLFDRMEDVCVIEDRGTQAASEDLFLGSQCRHFVLTNHSTYSHWMVELSKNHPNRIVYANSLEDVVTRREISYYYTPSHCEVLC